MRQILVTIASLLTIAGCGAGPTQTPVAIDAQILGFASATFPHGVPYDRAKQIVRQPQAEGVLLSVVDHPPAGANRATLVVMLGILGTPGATQRVIDTTQAGTGVLAPEEATLRMDAVTALGYAAYVNSDTALLDYLIDGLSATGWPTKVNWKLPDGSSPAPRLRSRAIAALGLSARPQALQVLVNLQTVMFGGGTPVRSDQALIAEAIRTNQYIAANQPDGMIKYYQAFLK